MPNEDLSANTTSAELHLYCSICLSIFLVDTPDEAEAVATPCGHVYHRDCIERVMDVQPQPQCPVCAEALPVESGDLLKLFIVFEEANYDKTLQDAVRSATSFDNHALDAAAAEAECQDKIQALRSEQEYNKTLLVALETEWSAIEKINATAKARMKALETELAQAENKLRELDGELLGVDGMSSDESSVEDDITYYSVLRKKWRHGNLTTWLRVFDAMYRRLRVSKTNRKGRGASVHWRQVTTRYNDTRGPVHCLPKSAYDPEWLNGLNDMEREDLAMSEAQYAFTHAPEVM
ncbi:hypothetical protein TRAPUB_13108, partial [Trametes pubescens]